MVFAGYVDVAAGPQKSDFYIIFLPNFPPISIPFWKKKVPQKVGTYTYTMSIWEPPPPDFFVPHKYRGVVGWDGNKLQNDNFKNTETIPVMLHV